MSIQLTAYYLLLLLSAPALARTVMGVTACGAKPNFRIFLAPALAHAFMFMAAQVAHSYEI